MSIRELEDFEISLVAGGDEDYYVDISDGGGGDGGDGSGDGSGSGSSGGSSASSSNQPTGSSNQPTGQCPSGTNNPTCPGTNSATDQVAQAIKQGNYGTAVGTAISNAPTIIGNGIDGMVNILGSIVNPTTTNPTTRCVTNTTSGSVTCPIGK